MGNNAPRVSGRGNTLMIINALLDHEHSPDGGVVVSDEVAIILENEMAGNEDTNASSDADVSASSATGGAAGTETGTAAGASGGFTEVGHKSAADVAAEEATSAYVVAGVKSTMDLQATINGLMAQLTSNAISTANTVNSNLANMSNQQNQDGQNSSNLINKQGISHRDIAIIQWADMDNIAEAVSAKVLAKMALEQ